MKRINFPWRFFLLHLAFSGMILFFIAGCDNIQASEEEDLTAFLALTNASQNGAPGEAFYTPPSPLPEGDHGDLISYRQADVALPGPRISLPGLFFTIRQTPLANPMR